MGEPPTKFPRTRHIINLGGIGRDDLVMDSHEVQQWMRQPLCIEEKIDGTNLGFSLDADGSLRAQNRSHFVCSATHPQFKPLDAWIQRHRAEVFAILETGRILYGEWMYLKHSIFYDNLPGYFVAFDIFDLQRQEFLSRRERNRLLEDTTIPIVPLVFEGQLHSEQEVSCFL